MIFFFILLTFRLKEARLQEESREQKASEIISMSVSGESASAESESFGFESPKEIFFLSSSSSTSYALSDMTLESFLESSVDPYDFG